MNATRTTPLTSADRDVFRDALAAQRALATEQIASLTRNFEDIVEAVEQTNNDDEHDPEGTTIAFERAQVSALLNQAKADLAAIDAALERLDGDAFGTCEVCAGLIGTARLEAIPAATKCVSCAS